MMTALVCGAGGFIGTHIVRQLKKEGAWVRGVDLHYPEFSEAATDEFIIADLRDSDLCQAVLDQKFSEVYQLAADMGGAGYIFTDEHDAGLMYNSSLINLNMIEACRRRDIKRLFYSSSACIYPARNQQDPQNPNCSENSAYPADPDSEYGWEKVFSERLYLAFNRNFGMECRIARYHNIFGPEAKWEGGKEKAPAAIYRKVIEAKNGDEIEIWGDGKQTRSFLYIDECVDGTLHLMRSPHIGPFNIGSDEMVTIDQLAQMIMEIAGKDLTLRHIPGPTGVRGRNSDNRLIEATLGWAPSQSIRRGLEKTYEWIEQRMQRQRNKSDLRSPGSAGQSGV